MPDDMKEAQRLGITLYAGEAEEGRLDAVLKDAYAGTLKPLYNFMANLPDMNNQPMPILPEQHVRRTAGTMTSVDLGRGCPYQCSFCTIINVQGRKSRFRSADDLEPSSATMWRRTSTASSLPTTTSRATATGRPFFDRLIMLREEEGFDIKFTIQVDTLCHQIPNFIEKAGAPAWRACSSGWRTSIPTACSAPRRSRTASPSTAPCCRPGRSRAHHLCRLHPGLSQRHARKRSSATSRSSSASCRSTSSSSSS